MKASSVTTVWTDDVPTLLAQLVGESVVVCVSELPSTRKNSGPIYHTQISVKGKLQIRKWKGKPEDDPMEFRVFSDIGTYAYFRSSDVMSLMFRDDTFEDGSQAVIFLGIDQTIDPEPIKNMLDEAMKKMNEKDGGE